MRTTEPPDSRLPDTRLHRRRILVCLDRSGPAEVCVAHAISLAKTFGSAITLVHVMAPGDERDGPHANDPLGWEISRQEARNYLQRIQREAATELGQSVDVRLEQGRPAERIADLGRELSADLIVIGSRGDGHRAGGELGGTAQQVLASAGGSVLVVHPSSGRPASVEPHHILVALDGSTRTESVLPIAARIASVHGAELLLVHVVREPMPTALLRGADDMKLARTLAARLEAGARRYLDRLRERFLHDVPAIRTIVARHANEHQCLLEIAQREHADLLVISAHGSTCDSGRAFGSVAAYLLSHTPVPLLALQDLPGELHPMDGLDGKQAPPPLRTGGPSEIA